MNPSQGLLPKLPRLLSLQACVLLAVSAASAQVAPAPVDATPPSAATTTTTTTTTTTAASVQSNPAPVVLSPFEVQSDTNGYYSANTEAGTRINSKVDDLGAAISIVTKQQMDDFAMLDINDVFLYTVNAMGTGTYTAETIDRNGSPSDNNQLNPTQANLVRGLAPANIAWDNFESMGREPVDPINIDSVEVSRGPNASVFGLGNPSGTVNMVGAKANVSRDFTHIAFRADSYDGNRSSLDVNRALFNDTKLGSLAVRLSGVFQHDGFERKPSGINEERYNAMIEYKPFRWTTINASYSIYRANGNRPNDVMPRDSVSYWLSQGSPGWDPITSLIHVNGTTIGPITASTFPSSFNGVNTDYFNNSFTGSTRSYLMIDQGGLEYWTAPSTFNTASGPITNASSLDRYMSPSAETGVTAGKPANQPLFSTTPTVGSKALYDYSSINLASVNRQTDQDLNSEVSIDQIVIDTPLQNLAFQGAFYQEDSQRYTRNIVGIANANGQSGQLLVNVNIRNLDGTPNPFYLRPYIAQDQPITFQLPSKWDTYRLQMAYKLDFTTLKDSWLKWLGLHQLSAYDDYKYRINRSYGYKDANTSPEPWVTAGLSRGNQGAITGGPAAALGITRGYFEYYVGGATGTGKVQYAPTDFSYGSYPFVWGNQLNGSFSYNPTELSQVAVTDSTGGSNNTKIILKSMGAVLQSHFLNDDIVTTIGEREDKQYEKFGATPQLLNPDGVSLNYASVNPWAAGDYNFHSGKTTQEGAVVRPFKDFSWVHNLEVADSPYGRFLGQLFGGMSLSYNKSDSFIPQSVAYNDFLTELPNTTGSGNDWGLGLNLFNGKVVLSVRRYDDAEQNSRNGDAGTIAQRVLRIDVASTAAFLLVNQANNWVAAINPTFSQGQINATVASEIGIPFNTITQLQQDFNSGTISSTNNVEARGEEFELNFNPSRFWTTTANFSVTQVINSNVSQDIQNWLNLRMPIWTTIVDPRTNTLWWTTNYGGSQTAMQNYTTFVQSPFAIIEQQQGKTNPEVREYNARVSTNYRLAGMTDNPILKNVFIGGALRWESAGAIGYYGAQQLPAEITSLNPNEPVYDPAHLFVDGLIGYRTRIFGNRVPMTVQLNVRNIQEGGGHLQPIAAFPDGTPSAFAIIDPRQYILTVSFDL